MNPSNGRSLLVSLYLYWWEELTSNLGLVTNCKYGGFVGFAQTPQAGSTVK